MPRGVVRGLVLKFLFYCLAGCLLYHNGSTGMLFTLYVAVSFQAHVMEGLVKLYQYWYSSGSNG